MIPTPYPSVEAEVIDYRRGTLPCETPPAQLPQAIEQITSVNVTATLQKGVGMAGDPIMISAKGSPRWSTAHPGLTRSTPFS